MKRIYFALAAAGLLVYLAGCCADGHCPSGCGSGCGGNCPQAAQGGGASDEGFFSAYHGEGLHRPPAETQDQYQDAGAAAAGAITYPYYTNRGPRDYFDRNPASIGP